MSKCQMNKYRAGGRCGGSVATDRCGGEASSAKVVSGALANLMAAREQQDRAFAPADAAADAPAKVTSQAIVKQVAPPRPEKKECIDIILGGDF
jgi:succinate dehydrogenase/fumarate reductase flavoprotein subunit